MKHTITTTHKFITGDIEASYTEGAPSVTLYERDRDGYRRAVCVSIEALVELGEFAKARMAGL